MYLKFIQEDKEIILTPEVIRDIRKQLEPQIKEIPFGVLIETVEASGLSVKNLINLFKKVCQAVNSNQLPMGRGVKL